MNLTDKERLKALLKLKHEMDLLEFAKKVNDRLKDGLEKKDTKVEDTEKGNAILMNNKNEVKIPDYIETYILTVSKLGEKVSITDIITASSDHFSLEIDKVRAWLEDPNHQRDLLHVYFGGLYKVEKEVKNTPKYSLTISSTEHETKVVLKDTASNKFKLVDEDTYYDIKDTPWVEDEFTPDELTDLKLENLLGDF